MYEFQFLGQENEPTQEEINQGFIHHIATLLNLHGVGKHFVNSIRELENRPITKSDIYAIMNHNSNQIDKVKDILCNCPVTRVKKWNDENDED